VRLFGRQGNDSAAGPRSGIAAWRGGGSGSRAISHQYPFTEVDHWGPVSFDMPPDPERGTVQQRVRQLIEALGGAVDEGSGTVLDLMIDSWVAAWIATVETAYADHCRAISGQHNRAAQWLTEKEAAARHETDELERVRADYLACRARLAGEQPDAAPADGAGPGGPARGEEEPAGDLNAGGSRDTRDRMPGGRDAEGAADSAGQYAEGDWDPQGSADPGGWGTDYDAREV